MESAATEMFTRSRYMMKYKEQSRTLVHALAPIKRRLLTGGTISAEEEDTFSPLPFVSL
jgi:hypothetical protein